MTSGASVPVIVSLPSVPTMVAGSPSQATSAGRAGDANRTPDTASPAATKQATAR